MTKLRNLKSNLVQNALCIENLEGSVHIGSPSLIIRTIIIIIIIVINIIMIIASMHIGPIPQHQDRECAVIRLIG